MTSRKDPDAPRKPKGAVSRRGFLEGVGIGGGVVGTGIITTAQAEPQAAAAAGPGP
ncbi:MAG: twin-arginine translocation signal domain-containing protein, partial [Bryobacteraceae bacterium]